MKRRDRTWFRDWPAPLPAEKQIEIAREMAHLRSKVRYLGIWKLACCRVQDLLGWNRYHELQRAATREYQRARNILWETNMSLVGKIAQRFAHDVLTVEELVSIGSDTLPRVLDGFDPYRGFRLSTYLWCSIQREFARAIRVETRRRQRCQLVDTQDQWDDLLGVEPEPDYDAAACDLHGEVRRAIADLDPREREIVIERASAERPTLEAVGRARGISKERTRQLERRGLEQVARQLGAAGVCCGLGRV